MSSASTVFAQLPPRLYRRFYLLAATPPLLAGLGAVAYREFVIHAIMTNIVINIIILGTASLGVILMMGTIAGIVREWRGFARLRAGPLGQVGRAEIDRLMGARLLIHLDELRDGHLSLLDQSHLHEEMNELREGLNGRQELGQYLVGLMVALGLLGTFIGLLETLVGVGQLIGSFGGNSGSLDDSFRALLGNLQRPLAAMGTAFAASMFGLIGSLLLGLVQIVVRSAQASFLDYAHDVANGIAQISEHAVTVPDAPTSQAWLAAVLDDMLAAQRGLVDLVGALRDEGQRSEARISALADTVQAIGQATQILAQSAGRHDRALEALETLPPQIALLHEAALGLEAQLSGASDEFWKWQRDLDRRHAIALRYFGRLGRQNGRDFAAAVDVLAQGQQRLVQELTGEQAREDRRAMRSQAHLVSAIERLSDELLGRNTYDETIVKALREVIDQGAQGHREIAARLDRIVEFAGEGTVEPEQTQDIDVLLRRLDELESRVGRDLRTAVAALTRHTGEVA